MHTRAIIAAVPLLVCAGSAGAQATFQALPVPAGFERARVTGISGDGTTVVGVLVASPVGQGPDRAFRWTRGGGVEILPLLPGYDRAAASAVSADGSIVMGWNRTGAAEWFEVFRWTAATGAVDAQFGNVGIRAGSADLSVVAGSTFVGGFFWAQPWGYVPLFEPSVVSGVTSDGRTLLGDRQPAAGLFTITLPGGGQSPIPPPAQGSPYSGGISRDGRVIVGLMAFPSPQPAAAFSWTAAGGYRLLQGGSPTSSDLVRTNRDGTVIAAAAPNAAIWTNGEYHDVAAMLASMGVTEVSQWTLNRAPLVSDEGRALAGTGVGPLAPEQGWVATLPRGIGCPANCDGSTADPALNVNDFICFLAKYAAGDVYANCDESTTPPVLNVNDFICFQQRYAAGCP